MKNIRAVIDLETSGFSRTKNAVMEIGLLLFDENYEVVGTFQTYIKPYLRPQEEGKEEELVSYKEDALKVNGLSVELIEKKGFDVEEVVNDLIHIFKDDFEVSEIFAHNSKFDEGFLNVLFDRFGHGFRFPCKISCTQSLAKEKLKVDSYSLENLCEYFGIVNKNAHSSIGDCEATLELLKELENGK